MFLCKGRLNYKLCIRDLTKTRVHVQVFFAALEGGNAAGPPPGTEFCAALGLAAAPWPGSAAVLPPAAMSALSSSLLRQQGQRLLFAARFPRCFLCVGWQQE